MTDTERRKAAKAFAEYWKDRGDEKSDSQSFWLALCRDVLGVAEPEKFILFEERVKLDHTSFIDGHIPSTHVLIEQKKRGLNLRAPIRQSDGTLLNPFQQAQRYSAALPYSQRPRWIITCNFEEFLIYDMEKPTGEPESIMLKDLQKEYYRLQFLVEEKSELLHREEQISIQAGELVGKLYDAILKQYIHPDDKASLHSLNILCVRLVFCLYAEDAGIFGGHLKFHNYIKSFEPRDVRRALIDLFRVLDTKIEDRDPYMDERLAAFPYVNGGLFADEHIEIPNFTQDIVNLLLHNASEDFDWSQISPTIFGAVFESTLNPETRRSGGMHYTSIENIHKVIDPLFLDELREEFDEIRALKVPKILKDRAYAFCQKLSKLTFFDPACGSGNFLTETYISLRRLENEALRHVYQDQMVLDTGDVIQVSIGQFYGIEINDFAVTVAKTALWIAESQMMKETEDILATNLDFLPLKSYANIIEGNALRVDWESVVPKDKLNYIMGNPPFVGKKEQTSEQKAEIKTLIHESTKTGILDYVSGWFYKAAQFMKGSPQTKSAFVSTDSICQGEHVPSLWKVLVEYYGVKIVFAYNTFKWNNEAANNAEVYCTIVGIANGRYTNKIECNIFSDKFVKKVSHINPYLLDAPDIWLSSANRQISGYSKINYGSMPIDNGYLILDEDEYKLAISKEPNIDMFLKKYAGADELLKGNIRYCIWLLGASRKEIINSKFLSGRVIACREFRRNSKRSATNKLAITPELFGEIRQPNTDMIVIPKVSSKHRDYIPMMLIGSDEYIINGSALIIANGNLYELGILSSKIHNFWVRAIAETWGHSYQYSTDIYNNFPFPKNENYRKEIELATQKMLDIRSSHSDLTLADMYSPKLGIISDLLIAHQQIDNAVMQAYGFDVKTMTESSCVAELMKMYQELTRG